MKNTRILAIGLLLGVLQVMAQSPSAKLLALAHQADSCYMAGDYAAASAMYGEALMCQGAGSNNFYNAACCAAKAGIERVHKLHVERVGAEHFAVETVRLGRIGIVGCHVAVADRLVFVPDRHQLVVQRVFVSGDRPCVAGFVLARYRLPAGSAMQHLQIKRR